MLRCATSELFNDELLPENIVLATHPALPIDELRAIASEYREDKRGAGQAARTVLVEYAVIWIESSRPESVWQPWLKFSDACANVAEEPLD